MLHAYVGRANDTFSLHVGATAKFPDAIDLFSNFHGQDIKFRHDACLVSADLASHQLNHGGRGRSLASVLRAWGVPACDGRQHIPVLLVVEPVAILVMSRLFHTLALQSSRFLSVPDLRILRRCGQVGDVASLQRFDELMKEAAACPPRAGRGQIDLHNIARIASHLRRWAPAIVPAHTKDDDGASSSDDSLAALASQRRMHLRWCLFQLDNLRESLEAKDWREVRHGGRGWQFDTYSLLQCVRLCSS